MDTATEGWLSATIMLVLKVCDVKHSICGTVANTNGKILSALWDKEGGMV